MLFPCYRKNDLYGVWPEPPEGFNPATREILEQEEEEEPQIYVDGFLIETVWEDEEPVFVSREEEVVMPDYSGASAKCCICGSSFQDILHSVHHVHRRHGVLGGPRLIMLGEYESLSVVGIRRDTLIGWDHNVADASSLLMLLVSKAP